MIKKTGKWVMTSDGLEIYDRSNELIKCVKDEYLLNLFSDMINDFNYSSVSIGDIGINNLFKSKNDNEIEQKEIEYINSHCRDCNKELKRTSYKLNSKILCPKCYRKHNSDSIVNKIKIKVV